jgi:outer membrane autotransporter protein
VVLAAGMTFTSGQAQAACSALPGPVVCSAGPYGPIDDQNDAVGVQNNLSVTLQDGVIVTAPTVSDGVAIEQGGNLTLITEGTVTIGVVGGADDRDGLRVDSIDNGNVVVNSTANITVNNLEGDGIVARSNSADNEAAGWEDNDRSQGTDTVSVVSSGTIDVFGNMSTGITAGAAGASVAVTVTGDITTEGATESGAIVAQNYSTSALSQSTVNVTDANLSTLGELSGGIIVGNVTGFSTINSTGGTIHTVGERSLGMGAAAGLANINDISGGGDPLALIGIGTPAGAGVTINNGTALSATNNGTAIETDGEWAMGVVGFSKGGAINILNRGTIDTGGPIASGIGTLNTFVPLFIPSKGGATQIDNRANIHTEGDSSAGILAVSLSTDIGIVSSGAISTSGGTVDVPELAALGVPINSSGIQAVVASALGFGGYGNVRVSTLAGGTIETGGDVAHGIEARTAFGTVTVMVGDSIDTAGAGADGVNAISLGTGFGATPLQPNSGLVDVTAGADITAIGENASGVLARSANSVTTAVLAGADVQGGWGDLAYGANLTSTAASGQSISLTNNGTVGALSDFAVLAGGGTNGSVIDNFGTIVGYVATGNGADVFNNYSADSLDLRHFEDTDGNLERDTEAVAISDFGAGIDLFNNDVNGALRLITVPNTSFAGLPTDPAGPTAWDTAGMYVPAGYDASLYDINLAGVEQGQLVNIETFNHAGVITMQDLFTGGSGPVAGDVLVMTGGAGVSDGAITPAGGVFQSNGGALYLDTMLNEGGVAASQSDVLVVDTTVTVGGGATRISITNAGGAGASTDLNNNGSVDEGEGILVVEVLDAANSATDAFTLGGPVIAGAWTYSLFQGPAGGDWYLVNALAPTVDVYAPYVETLTNFGRDTLGTLQQRSGNRIWPREEAPQTVFCKDATQNFRCAVSPDQADYYASSDSSALSADGLWARIGGSTGSFSADEGSAFDQQLWFVQGGFDATIHEDEAGTLTAGLFATYGSSSSDILGDGGLDAGSIDSDGYGLGGALTWLGTNGFYTDAVGQVTWYDSSLSASGIGELADDVDAVGYTLSVEMGKRLALANDWWAVPQAQLVWSKIDFDTFTDTFGAEISGRDTDSLLGRLGLRVENVRDWTDGSGKVNRLQVYAVADLLYEFDNETSVGVSGVDLEQRGEALWGDIGIGGTLSLNNRFSLFGEGSYATALDSVGDEYVWKGDIGLKLNW